MLLLDGVEEPKAVEILQPYLENLEEAVSRIDGLGKKPQTPQEISLSFASLTEVLMEWDRFETVNLLRPFRHQLERLAGGER